MQDPPHTIDQIRLLLSQALDGTLSHEDAVILDAVLERFPEYQAELKAMQTLHGRLNTVLNPETTMADRLPEKEMTGIWQAISAQLADDWEQQTAHLGTSEVESTAFEFLSAYHDGEILPEDPEFIAFEARLYHDDASNAQLGQLTHLSQAIRESFYRLEESVTTSSGEPFPDSRMTASVLSALNGESSLESPLQDDELELLSALVDEELKPQEMILAQRLIEGNSPAQACLQDFNTLSSAIREALPRWEETAPLSDWSVIHQQLLEESGESNVMPFAERRKALLKPFWLAAPMVAAASLLVVSWPSLQINQLLGLSPAVYNSSSALSDGSNAGVAVASVPKHLSSRTSMFESDGSHTDISDHVLSDRLSQPDLVSSSPSHLSPVNSGSRTYQTIAPPARPMIDPAVKQMASGRRRGMIDGSAVSIKAPSSEEYLLNALNERGSAEDITNILGD